ncbi:SWIM zinc finger family protein [Glaciimonas sp. PAMC28666]|nr:SWIM zinc finger family protein [Glaciimonas sp. PAMC28666]
MLSVAIWRFHVVPNGITADCALPGAQCGCSYFSKNYSLCTHRIARC